MKSQPGRRERKRQQTADQLADTAWRMFEAHGFENVTMESIAAEADVAKGTLYNYFPIKEALLRHKFHGELQQHAPKILEEIMQLPNCRDKLAAFMQVNAEWTEARRPYVAHYLKYRMVEGSEQRAQRSGMDLLFGALLEPGFHSGELKSTLSLDDAVHYLSYLYLAAMMRWLQKEDRPLIEELNAMIDLFFDGLGANK